MYWALKVPSLSHTHPDTVGTPVLYIYTYIHIYISISLSPSLPSFLTSCATEENLEIGHDSSSLLQL
jgi:hypothetical protein